MKTPSLQVPNKDYVTLSDDKAFRTPGEGQNILTGGRMNLLRDNLNMNKPKTTSTSELNTT